MAAEQTTLLTELGLEQNVREMQGKSAEQQVTWLADDFELQQQVQDKITEMEDSVFEAANQLRGEVKDSLGMILDSLQGVNPDTMPAQTRAQLQSMAAQTGVPLDLIMQGLKVQYQRQVFDESITKANLALNKAQEARLASDSDDDSGGETIEERNRAAAASMGGQLSSVSGSDGYVNPDDYKLARRTWIEKGFLPKDFDERFVGYVNPTHYKDYGLKEKP